MNTLHTIALCLLLLSGCGEGVDLTPPQPIVIPGVTNEDVAYCRMVQTQTSAAANNPRSFLNLEATAYGNQAFDQCIAWKQAQHRQ